MTDEELKEEFAKVRGEIKEVGRTLLIVLLIIVVLVVLLIVSPAKASILMTYKEYATSGIMMCGRTRR